MTTTAPLFQSEVKKIVYTLRVSPSNRTKTQLQQQYIKSHATQNLWKYQQEYLGRKSASKQIYFITLLAIPSIAKVTNQHA